MQLEILLMFLICAGGSYLIGAIPFGYLIGRCHGMDIRRVGSGNIGATNVTRALGIRWGRLCFALDFLKGAIPVLLTAYAAGRWTPPEWAPEFFRSWAGLIGDPWNKFMPGVAAFAAVSGHVWPIYLGFRGGKGVSTAAGAILALNWAALATAALVWAVVFLIGRYVSLASIVAAIALPVASVVYDRLGVQESSAPEVGLFFLLAALAVLKHLSNIKRLFYGTESRFERSQKLSQEERQTPEPAETQTPIRAAILGDGAWGTALALTLHDNGHSVRIWSAFPENAEAMNRDHENAKFLPGVPLPEDILCTPDMAKAVDGADMLVLATPSQYMRPVLRRLKPLLRPGVVIVDIAKGIETGSLLRMSELCEQELGRTRYVALSGPSHAEEVSRRIPTLIVSASADPKAAKFVQTVFMNDCFRVYTSGDVVGVELGGALKNIYAIAAGMLDGAGMGDNSKAALMTRAIAEMARLGRKLGGRTETFSGLSGVGDLIVTCTSRHSRNRHVGEELGKGRKLDDVIRSMNMVVAEGVKTCESAYALAEKHNVDAPLIRGIYQVLHDGRDPREVMRELMKRKAKHESE